MRPEKSSLTRAYLERLNASPFVILVNYTGLKVGPLTELRRRLRSSGASLHVVKNSLLRLAAREAGLGDWAGALTGQLAVVTGGQDISLAAKVIKTFAAEFERPKFHFGYLGNQRLEAADLLALADLPSRDALRAQLLGALTAPAANLLRLLAAPAAQLARVVRARVDQAAAPASAAGP